MAASCKTRDPGGTYPWLNPLFAVGIDNGSTSQIGVLSIIKENPGGPSCDRMTRGYYIIQLGIGGAQSIQFELLLLLFRSPTAPHLHNFVAQMAGLIACGCVLTAFCNTHDAVQPLADSKRYGFNFKVCHPRCVCN